MKVLIIQTGEIADFQDGYAVRLIEQGKANPIPAAKGKAAEAKPEAPEKAEDAAPKAEEKKTSRKK